MVGREVGFEVGVFVGEVVGTGVGTLVGAKKLVGGGVGLHVSQLKASQQTEPSALSVVISIIDEEREATSDGISSHRKLLAK
jgi:hypothetical protein